MDRAMYILVNKDINIVNKDGKGAGKLGGQIGHAVSAYIYNKFIKKGLMPTEEDLNEFREYMDNTQKKIILYCPEKKLEELEAQGYITIRDNGLTMLNPNTLTCVNLGVFDRDKDEVPKWVKRLRLVN